MIDLHTHIMPGVDDGASDIQETLEMVCAAAEAGITVMAATPHCNIPGVYDNYYGEQYLDSFRRVLEAVAREQLPVQILPGAEVFATYHLPELLKEGKIVPLNGTRYILMEFAFDEDPDYAEDVLRRVKDVGAKPVIAHVERYGWVQDFPQTAYEWRKKGYLIQANSGSFLGAFGEHARWTAYQLLDHNLLSLVASDAHKPHRRRPDMTKTYERLCEEKSERYLKVLFEENPHRICLDWPAVRFKLRPFE